MLTIKDTTPAVLLMIDAECNNKYSPPNTNTNTSR